MRLKDVIIFDFSERSCLLKAKLCVCCMNDRKKHFYRRCVRIVSIHLSVFKRIISVTIFLCFYILFFLFLGFSYVGNVTSFDLHNSRVGSPLNAQ